MSFQNKNTLTTGLSDFHKMVITVYCLLITVLKTAIAILIPKKMIYKDCKNVDRGKFNPIPGREAFWPATYFDPK